MVIVKGLLGFVLVVLWILWSFLEPILAGVVALVGVGLIAAIMASPGLLVRSLQLRTAVIPGSLAVFVLGVGLVMAPPKPNSCSPSLEWRTSIRTSSRVPRGYMKQDYLQIGPGQESWFYTAGWQPSDMNLLRCGHVYLVRTFDTMMTKWAANLLNPAKTDDHVLNVILFVVDIPGMLLDAMVILLVYKVIYTGLIVLLLHIPLYFVIAGSLVLAAMRS